MHSIKNGAMNYSSRSDAHKLRPILSMAAGASLFLGGISLTSIALCGSRAIHIAQESEAMYSDARTPRKDVLKHLAEGNETVSVVILYLNALP